MRKGSGLNTGLCSALLHFNDAASGCEEIMVVATKKPSAFIPLRVSLTDKNYILYYPDTLKV